MPSYKAPVENVLFLLNDVLRFQSHGNALGYADVSPELIEQVLSEGAKLCEEALQPLNQMGDAVGCVRHDDASVTTPPGFKAAYDAFAEGGWIGLAVPQEYGGQGLPYTLAVVINEFASSANMSFAMYPGLTQGALAALLRHGDDEQKQLYAPKMASGRWTGTMNLTEPQCGTDLGLLTTKATPRGDGCYSITGQKIFISAGEHDLTENIVHLVLARIEGAPAGVKGISLFVVPKFRSTATARLDRATASAAARIEHKMGIHGNATCVMNYDGAQGFLVGEANRGLNAMFVMMNEARLGVAMQGLAQSEVAYQNAAQYAKERLQGRALSGPKDPGEAGRPDHRASRRAAHAARDQGLQRGGARLRAVGAALDSDIAHRSQDAAARQAAEDRLGLLTPVLKGVLTDVGFDNTVKAQQVLRRTRLYSRMGHGAVRARCAHQP